MSRDRSDPGSGGGPSRYPGTFLLAFREAMTGLGWQVVHWLGDAVDCADAEGEKHTVGLENLYRRCRREDRTRWPELIREFLAKVRSAEVTADAEADLAAVAGQLLVRLGKPFAALPDSMHVWSRQLQGTPLCLNLVIDHPETMSYVTQEMVEKSGRSGDEWLAQALDNLHERTPADCFSTIHEESGMLLCSVADAYDSSRALLLDALLPESHGFGCFVAIPSRDELLVLPVSRSSLAYVHLMKLLADRNFKTAPYAISNELYWVRQGDWCLFPAEMRGSELVVTPPAPFAEMLNLLPPEEGEAEEDKT